MFLAVLGAFAKVAWPVVFGAVADYHDTGKARVQENWHLVCPLGMTPRALARLRAADMQAPQYMELVATVYFQKVRPLAKPPGLLKAQS